MKSFIKNEIKCAHKIYNKSNNQNALKTIEELYCLKKDIFKLKNNIFEYNQFNSILGTKLDDQVYNFMIDIIDIYAQIPQLDTEISLKYPLVNKHFISNQYIYDFSNRVLEKEKFIKSFTFNNKSLLIFENKSLKLKRADSRCLLYTRHYTSTGILILNKYNNIRDLILPLKKFIEVIQYYDNNEFSNETEIMEYYMLHKAIKELIKNGNMDAKKIKISCIDNMVYTARLLKKLTNNKNWNQLSSLVLFKLLDFINHAIAIELVYENKISLNDLYTTFKITSNRYTAFNSLSISKKNIEHNKNIYVNKLTKKQY